ncbi:MULTISPECIES: hypothetical protein [Vibrio]|uniref:Uncharacterized protein n=1 Tax=Vibrio tasmaniensis TaxID=212663 RepID=A0A2N7NN92_9VIBR|nr:hypothetical protein [Vibrio tasmaniensis]PMO89904.1 hypothetical protein BCT01_01070 [Vibrio tasmaniensis]PMP17771.1 hypothetical protein BCS92_05025 [Vibrio tasmaniensis]TKG28009.1 hypothetical protein FC057_22745 [Vibrio tasmaniensis]TKG41626.1 hypothetical protein FC063_07125 [Vibrio tasmaniensis]TKG44870.1 hypothetical protein FC061_20260 [Vibrio tasmaniensis]
MSHQIEVGKVSLKLNSNLGEDFYVVYQLAGCNNLIDECGRFSRSWNIVASGLKKTIAPKIERLAEIAESGGIQPMKGRRSTAKSYIKAMKTRLNKSTDYVSFQKAAPISKFMGRVNFIMQRSFAEDNKDALKIVWSQFLTIEDVASMEYKRSYKCPTDQPEDLIYMILDLGNPKHADFLISIHKDIPLELYDIELSLIDQADDIDHAIFESIKHIDKTTVSTQ